MPYVDIADKDTLDKMNNKIGVTSDSGGSSTSGTVMAKLNKLIGSTSWGESYVQSTKYLNYNVSTSSFTTSPRTIKRVKLGSFICTDAGKVTIVVDGKEANDEWGVPNLLNSYIMRVFLSTTNTSNPSESTEANAIATSNSSSGLQRSSSAIYMINNVNVSARTYYLYMTYDASREWPTPSQEIDKITQITDVNICLTYNTSVKQSTFIKSLQSGVSSGSYQSINPVDPSRCIVIVSSMTSNVMSGGDMSYAYAINSGYILMPDRIRFIRYNNSSGYNSLVNYGYPVCWQIIEFY